MKASEIINAANVRADEQIELTDMLGFLNDAISETSMELKCMLPIVDSDELDQDYYVMRPITFVDVNNKTPQEIKREKQFKSANRLLISILIDKIVYYIKVQDGSDYEWQRAENSFKKNIRVFNSTYKVMIDEDWLTSNIDIDGEGTRNENGFGVYNFSEDSYTGTQSTWGGSEAAGTGNVGNGLFIPYEDSK